jgi:hypothetical protein
MSIRVGAVVFDGVGQQVQQNLPQAAPVGLDVTFGGGLAGIDVDFDQVGGGERSHQADGLAQQRGHVHGLGG